MDNKYNWEYFTGKEKIAYREFLQGNDSLLKEHNIIKNCESEIKFAIRIAEIFFNITPSGAVIDVGCGGGFMTQCFSRLGFNATGFDITEEGIKAAKQNWSGIEFFVGDGTKPKDYFHQNSFNLIHIREFHPFKVLNDFNYQIKIIEDYLDILCTGGIIVITQARPGIMGYGNEWKKYECLDYNLLKRHINSITDLLAAGPFYFFLLNHLKLIPVNKTTIRLTSLFTRFLQIFLHQSWVEFFIIYKNS